MIELLVVITIIAILASMLMPALGKVKEKGRNIQCQGNQRQIAASIASYTGDGNGYLPLLADGSDFTYSYTWSKDICENYLSSNWNVFRCASAPKNWTVFNRWRMHYGYNYYMHTQDHFKDWVRIERITTPSTVIMTTDSTEDKLNPINGFYLTSYSYYHIRHGLGLNISYTDAHVTYVSKIPPNQPTASEADSGHPFFWKRWRSIF